jgi:hypothetical protein
MKLTFNGLGRDFGAHVLFDSFVSYREDTKFRPFDLGIFSYAGNFAQITMKSIDVKLNGNYKIAIELTKDELLDMLCENLNVHDLKRLVDRLASSLSKPSPGG